MAKIKDIADRTGYSITTVSRVLNQDQTFNVSDETRLKIMTASEELNYIPLSKRHKANKKKSLTFGLIYWYSISEELTDPYYLSIRLAVEHYCEAHEIILRQFRLPKNDLNELMTLKLDGLIVLGKYSHSEITRLQQLNSHLVLVDCYHKHYHIDVVMANLQEATEDIIDYFTALNLKAIGFIGGVERTLDGEILTDIRLKTYERHPCANPAAIYLGAFNADSGYHLMNQIIEAEQLQKAYIVASDAMAIGCLKALSEQKIKVPEEVSLISYDNISLSQYTIPALTTVDMNTKIMGETAVDLLVERVSTQRQIAKKVFIPTQLIRRGSSL